MENSFKLKGFVVWIICALFFLYEFMLRTIIGTYQHPIMYDLELNYFQFSLLSTTVFFLIYGVMQIPAGIITDNFGLKKTLLLACVICFFGCIGFSFAYNLKSAVAFRLMMGFGASFGFICLLVSVYDWMPKKYLAIFIGISQFIGTIGPIFAAGPLASLSGNEALNWRAIFWYLAFFGLVLSILVLLFVENNYSKSWHYTILNSSEGIKSSIKKLFTRLQVTFRMG